MKLMFSVQTALLIAGAALLWIFSTPQNTASYAAGSAVVLLNFVFLSTGWSLIFRKKWVAVAVAIIVIKYAILGVLLYSLIHQPWLDLLWFAVGVASFVGTALIFAMRTSGEATDTNSL